jgi:ribonuclease HI
METRGWPDGDNYRYHAKEQPKDHPSCDHQRLITKLLFHEAEMASIKELVDRNLLTDALRCLKRAHVNVGSLIRKVDKMIPRCAVSHPPMDQQVNATIFVDGTSLSGHIAGAAVTVAANGKLISIRTASGIGITTSSDAELVAMCVGIREAKQQDGSSIIVTDSEEVMRVIVTGQRKLSVFQHSVKEQYQKEPYLIRMNNKIGSDLKWLQVAHKACRVHARLVTRTDPPTPRRFKIHASEVDTYVDVGSPVTVHEHS